MLLVYLVKSGNYYKIGRSDNIDRRISEMQTGSPHLVQLVHKFETTDGKAEKLLHQIFKRKNRNREWFELTDLDILFICSISGFSDGCFEWFESPAITEHVETRPLRTYTFDSYGEEVRITENQIIDFLKTSWRRQQKNPYSFSKHYWCNNHQPRMRSITYEGIMMILVNAGIIINRRPGCMGEIAVTPDEAIAILRQSPILHFEKFSNGLDP
jgi:ribosomal protein L20